MTHMPRLDRRSFVASVAALGGGLALGFRVPGGIDAARAAALDGAGAPPELTAWVVIRPDDTVIIRVARSEMGQGVMTALPMLVAEELGCDWAKVQPEFPSPEANRARGETWGSMGTGGSRSVRDSHDYLLRAGATARTMLVAAAARQWGVAPGECHAANSVITHAASGRSVTFGKVAALAATLPAPQHVVLKDPKQWTLLGTAQKRFDTRDKITGKPVFAIDVRLPGMLYAAIRHSPVVGGAVKSVDDAKLRGRKGIHQIVTLPGAVAVVAESWWAANQALDQLAIVWDDRGHAALSSHGIDGHLRDGLTAADAAVIRDEGAIDTALAQAATRVEADYAAPFLAHATLEPMNCTAQVTADGVEVWVPTQSAEAALMLAAKAAGVAPDKVVVHKMMLGGGFGRRGATQDFVAPAVLVAKAAGRPVKLLWSREEDTRHDFYRPVAMARMTAGLDADGMPVAWHVRLSGQSIWASLRPGRGGVDRSMADGFTEGMTYAVPNYRVDYAMRNTPVPVGPWRSVNQSQNCFFKESFIDEMAHAAGQDPYQFRRKLLAHKPAQLAVLDAAAKAAGWDTPAAKGVFRGIGFNEANDSICCQIAEITLDNGAVKVRRVVAALDTGHVVNPAILKSQVESAIVYGLTAALYGEITVKDGQIEQGNFDTYEMVRMAQMPVVEVVLVPSGRIWGGAGEPPLPPIAPALCNAVFAATGKRVRALPLKNAGITGA